MSGRALFELARRLRRLTADAGALLLVNDRLDVALAAGADGVHLGTASMPPAAVREITPPGFLVGVSTHSPEEVRAAGAAGADYVCFGPVYETPSKKAYGPPAGLEALGEAAGAEGSVPVLALGGVKAGRVPELLGAGARGVALISAVFGAPDPEGATRRLLAAIKGESP